MGGGEIFKIGKVIIFLGWFFFRYPWGNGGASSSFQKFKTIKLLYYKTYQNTFTILCVVNKLCFCMLHPTFWCAVSAANKRKCTFKNNNILIPSRISISFCLATTENNKLGFKMNKLLDSFFWKIQQFMLLLNST